MQAKIYIHLWFCVLSKTQNLLCFFNQPMVRHLGLEHSTDWSPSVKLIRRQWLFLSKEGMRWKTETSGWIWVLWVSPLLASPFKIRVRYHLSVSLPHAPVLALMLMVFWAKPLHSSLPQFPDVQKGLERSPVSWTHPMGAGSTHMLMFVY